jgi:hypothetical protein
MRAKPWHWIILQLILILPFIHAIATVIGMAVAQSLAVMLVWKRVGQLCQYTISYLMFPYQYGEDIYSQTGFGSKSWLTAYLGFPI